MLRKIFFAALAALIMASSANAGVIVGLLLNPASTAGGGATSNRSGAGALWRRRSARVSRVPAADGFRQHEPRAPQGGPSQNVRPHCGRRNR